MEAGPAWWHQRLVKSRVKFRMGLKCAVCMVGKNNGDIKLSLYEFILPGAIKR